MLRDHCIFCWRKKEGMIWFHIICLKLYQLESTTWWYLSIPESILKSALKFVLLEKQNFKIKIYIIIKNHGLPKFASGPPLGGRPDLNFDRPWNIIHSPPCRTPCRLFIHEVFFGPLGLHLRVWSELGRSPPFWPMRATRSQWSWAFNLVCEVALSICPSCKREGVEPMANDCKRIQDLGLGHLIKQHALKKPCHGLQIPRTFQSSCKSIDT